MPKSLKPRVNVVVSHSQHQLLLELGALQGSSASGILRDLLNAAEPVFRATLGPLRAAKEAQDKLPDEARRLVLEALAPKQDEDDPQLTLESFLLHLASGLRADGEDGADRSVSEDRTARTARIRKPSK